MKIKVQQMLSNNDNPVQNQFIIYQNNDIYFQSYKSIICKIDKNNDLILDSFYWDYSITTLKYLYSFIERFKGYRPNKKYIYDLIKTKQIKLTDLNK